MITMQVVEFVRDYYWWVIGVIAFLATFWVVCWQFSPNKMKLKLQVLSNLFAIVSIAGFALCAYSWLYGLIVMFVGILGRVVIFIINGFGISALFRPLMFKRRKIVVSGDTEIGLFDDEEVSL